MKVTPAVVADEHQWCRGRGPDVVPLINDTRAQLAALFDAEVDSVTVGQYEAAVDAVFADGDLAVNVAALCVLLRELDVENDYPGFVVDEILGRELAGMLAGNQPLRLLAEATFHFADVHTHAPVGSQDGTVQAATTAGADDLDAALAAGFQTRLPGWRWRATSSPFSTGTD